MRRQTTKKKMKGVQKTAKGTQKINNFFRASSKCNSIVFIEQSPDTFNQQQGEWVDEYTRWQCEEYESWGAVQGEWDQVGAGDVDEVDGDLGRCIKWTS